MHTRQRGFTFIELIIVMGIFAVLASFTWVNLRSGQNRVSLSSETEVIIADIAHTRLQAMSGFGASFTGGNAHGIHLEEDKYVLFSGISYSALNSTNSVFMLPENIRFSQITFSGGNIIFATGSGEIVSYNPSARSFGITETNSSQTKTIELNALGTVIAN